MHYGCCLSVFPGKRKISPEIQRPSLFPWPFQEENAMPVQFCFVAGNAALLLLVLASKIVYVTKKIKAWNVYERLDCLLGFHGSILSPPPLFKRKSGVFASLESTAIRDFRTGRGNKIPLLQMLQQAPTGLHSNVMRGTKGYFCLLCVGAVPGARSGFPPVK